MALSGNQKTRRGLIATPRSAFPFTIIVVNPIGVALSGSVTMMQDLSGSVTAISSASGAVTAVSGLTGKVSMT